MTGWLNFRVWKESWETDREIGNLVIDNFDSCINNELVRILRKYLQIQMVEAIRAATKCCAVGKIKS